MLRFLVLIGVCAPALAGLWSPAYFGPRIAPDGSRTWLISIDTADIPEADRSLTQLERDTKIAAGFLGSTAFCPGPWEITGSRVEKKRLIIEGRCK